MGKQQAILHVYDTLEDKFVYEGNTEGACDFLNIERHNLYVYVNKGNLYKYRYKITRVGTVTRCDLVSDETKKQICEDFKSRKYKMRELAEKYNLSTFSIDTILIKNGLKNPRRGVEIKIKDNPRETKAEKIDKGKVVALYKANWSIEKIADEFITTKEIMLEVIRELMKEGKI